MGPDSGIYKVVLVLHLVTVIVGFGGLAVSGFLGAMAAGRRNRDGAVIGQAVDKGYSFSEWFVYAVPILGIVLVLLSEDVFTFGQLWISLSFVLYIVAIGLLHGVHLPTVRRIGALLAEVNGGSGSGGAPPQAAELDKLGAKAGAVGGVLNLIGVVIVFLMVFKPGFP
jgi:uncharacterized membrane protein